MPKSILDDPKRKDRLLKMLDEAKKGEQESKFDAEHLFEAISSRVIGQDPIVRHIAKKIENTSFLQRRDKPLASILITGPSGTGKTELAKALADAVYGEDDKFLYRLDCGTLGSSEADLASVIGSGGVYKGSSRGSLPDFLLAKRKGVLLFDELEKAVTSPDSPLAKMLLALLDEGRVQTKFDNSTCSASECIVILTSNAMQQEIKELTKDFVMDSEEALQELETSVKALFQGKVFATEFLNRLDLVTSSLPLTDEALFGVSEKIFLSQCEGYGIEIKELDPSCDYFFVEAAQKLEEKNARDLSRWMEPRVADAVSDYRRAGGEDQVKVVVKGEKVTFQPVKPSD